MEPTTDAGIRHSTKSEATRGYVALGAGVIAFGTAPLFVRAISAPALTIATYASWIAVVVMFVAARLAHEPITRSGLVSAIPGGILFALAQLLAFAAFQETSLAIASLITSMTPLVVVVAAVPLFGERLHAVQLVWAALAIAGVAAVILGAADEGGNALFGDLLALGSLVAGAGMLLMMKHRRMGGVAATSYTAGVFLMAALFETPVWLISGAESRIDGSDWLYLVLLAVFSLAAGMGAMAWAQRHVSVAVSSVLSLGATVITAIGAWVFFDQPLEVVQIVGGLLVLVSLAGIVTVQLGRHATPSAPS
jgi:drug/metabolite transporter (DMT)-like permease